MSNKQRAIIGFLGVIISIYMFSFNYLNVKKDKAFETMSYSLLVNNEVSTNTTNTDNTPVEEVTVPVEVNNEPVATPTEAKVTYNYIGMLEIPKIGLKRGFVDMNSPSNNVSKNVTIIKPSSYPDVEKGNFILAAHSGSTRISYFNYLYQLNINDKAYIYYKNIKYTYNIVNIYKQQKTGKVGLYRDANKTTLTLITCTNNEKTTQTVYIAELVEQTNY